VDSFIKRGGKKEALTAYEVRGEGKVSPFRKETNGTCHRVGRGKKAPHERGGTSLPCTEASSWVGGGEGVRSALVTREAPFGKLEGGTEHRHGKKKRRHVVAYRTTGGEGKKKRQKSEGETELSRSGQKKHKNHSRERKKETAFFAEWMLNNKKEKKEDPTLLNAGEGGLKFSQRGGKGGEG